MTTTSADAGNAIVVREATMADLLAVFRIEKASFSQPWPFTAFEHYLDGPGFLVAVDASGPADAEQPVVGYVVADLIPNHGRALGHVKDIAVHPERRGRGIGATLLERAINVLAVNDARTVKLEVRESNHPAISLYKRYGFEYLRTIPRYYDDGENAYVMVLDLRSSEP